MAQQYNIIAPSFASPATATITWGDAAGSGEDKTITLSALANNAGRMGAGGDIGLTSGYLPEWLDYEFYFAATSSPTAANMVRLFLAFSFDNSAWPGAVTGSDGAYSDADLFPHLDELKPLLVDNSTATQRITGSLWMPRARYVVPVVFNSTGVAFATGNDVAKFILRCRSGYAP